MKKLTMRTRSLLSDILLGLLISLLLGSLLAGCSGSTGRELESTLNSRPAAVTMPYDQPQVLVHAVPEDLPFDFSAYPGGELLGTVAAGNLASGTILQTVDASAEEILDYYRAELTEAAFTDANEGRSYQVFYPPEGSGAVFCSGEDDVVILQIFDRDDGARDVRLHYSTNEAVIARTTCADPILAIENFPFPQLPAPPNASVMGGGGGGGGGGGQGSHPGTLGYMVSSVIHSEDSLEAVNQHYVDLLAGEGWTLLGQSAGENSLESNWDFGFYQSRSWLMRLITSVGDEPNQYTVQLRAISP
jgi:hypothetical protein